MNKNSKIALSVITIFIIIFAAVAAIYYLPGNFAQPGSISLPTGNPPTTEIEIINNSAEKKLSISDLKQMALTTVTHTIKGETATYIGVTLTELLNKTDAPWDTGFIDIIAGDGYKVTINTYQSYNSTQYPGSEFILAFTKNGQWITDETEGPLKFIAPGLTSNYNIKCVAEIKLKPWTVTINGEVTDSAVIIGNNLTNYEVKTVTAAFAPGGEAQRTSDWTGITVSSILDSVGVSSSATKISVAAIDGYTREFTLDQVQSTGMLLGYQENGEPLSPVDGQPYRLIVPTEEFKWGQNWVRWVSEITIS